MEKKSTHLIKKEKRLVEWQNWINEFMDLNTMNPAPDYKAIPNAAELLNDYYWNFAEGFIKPLLNARGKGDAPKLHYYKIISLSELTIMVVKPFIFSQAQSHDARRKLNADFAWFVAVSILSNWQIDGIEPFDDTKFVKLINYKEPIDIGSNKGKYKNYPIAFMDEHIAWLKDLNTAAPLPVLSNSQTWRMVFLCIHGKF